MSLKHKLFAEGSTLEMDIITGVSPDFNSGLPLNQWEEDDEEYEEDDDLDLEEDDDLDEDWEDEEFDVDEEDFDLEEDEELEFDPYDDDDDDEDGFFDDEPEDQGHWVEDRNPSPRKAAYGLADELV